MTDATPAVAPAPAAAAAPAPAPAENTNVLIFRIPNTETDIQIDISSVPPELRMDMLKKALSDYVRNAVNQENVRTGKHNQPFDAYDEAMKADPLQTAVAKPEGERKVADLIETAKAARERLYKGEVRKHGEGTGRVRETKDPLTKLVTQTVVQELFDKNKAATPGYKWTDATKAVGGDGIKYLEARIAELVAAGSGTEADLRKFMDERYIKPAQLMLGIKTNKATADTSLL